MQGKSQKHQQFGRYCIYGIHSLNTYWTTVSSKCSEVRFRFHSLATVWPFSRQEGRGRGGGRKHLQTTLVPSLSGWRIPFENHWPRRFLEVPSGCILLNSLAAFVTSNHSLFLDLLSSHAFQGITLSSFAQTSLPDHFWGALLFPSVFLTSWCWLPNGSMLCPLLYLYSLYCWSHSVPWL